MERIKFYKDGNAVKVKIGNNLYGTDIPLSFIEEEEKLTEQEFLRRFKDKGFSMYKTEDIEKKLNPEQKPKRHDYVKAWDEDGADEFVSFCIYHDYDESDKQHPHRTNSGDFANVKIISKDEYEKVRNL